MRNFKKVISVLLACVMLLGLMSSCKESTEKEESRICVGKVNGKIIPDCIFINYFLAKSNAELGKEDTVIDATLSGEKIYEQLDELGLLQNMIDESLEEARVYMIEYYLCSQKDNWLKDDEKAKMKENAIAYIKELNSYYGSYYGTSKVEDFANRAYSMTYDDLVEFFTISGELEQYKINLEEATKLSDSDLEKYYNANIDKYYTVQVRQSLFLCEESAKEEDKAEVKANAQELVDKYNRGELTFDEIVEMSEDVDNEGNVNNDGYYIVYQDAGFVDAFEDWATAQKEASDKIALVESEHGIHIMQCTKVYGIKDKEVKDRVSEEYKKEIVSSEIKKEVDTAKTKKEYKLSEYNDEHTRKLAKRTFTGEFEKEETAPKEYNDAPMDKTLIAKYKDEEIYQGYYKQYFSQAVNETFAEYDSDELTSIEDEDKYYDALVKALNEEYKDGKSYIEYSKEYALELLLEYMATRELAIEAKYEYTEEEKKEMLAELDTQIDEMFEYYKEYSDFKTRDELMENMTGTNVNGYKAMYVDQQMVYEYTTEETKKIEVKDKELIDFYYDNEDEHKIITVRIIKKNLIDEKGERLGEDTIKQIKDLLNSLMKKIKNGDSAAALVETYSDSGDLSKYGLQDLTETNYSVDKAVIDWAKKQTKIGEMAVIECPASYELVIIEGITSIEKTEGIVSDTENVTPKAVKESVSEEYKAKLFDEKIKKYITDNKLELTDVKNDLIEKIVEEYMTFNKKEDKNDSDDKEQSTAQPEASDSTAKK